jgi:hypothetical protein
MDPEEWRDRVGQHVERRRRELFKSRRAAAAGSGISEIVWRQIESGRRQLAPGIVIAPNPEPETRDAVCKRLKWSIDSIDRLLEGKAPAEVEEVPFKELLAHVDKLNELVLALTAERIAEIRAKGGQEAVETVFDDLHSALLQANASLREATEESYAVAAEGTTEPEKQTVKRRANRPSPPPEPEGP